MRRLLAIVIAAGGLAGCSGAEDAAAWLTGGRYRPRIQPLGWGTDGHLLFVHTELRGGYDYLETIPCGGSGIYRTEGRSPPAPVLVGLAWCRMPTSHEVRAFLSADRRTVFVLPGRGYGDCTLVRALDLEARRWREAGRVCGSYVYGPAVSPDGGRIAAGLGCGSTSGGGEPSHVTPRGCVDRGGDRLTVMNLDGSGRRLVGEPGDSDPVWSPDGRALAVRPRGEGGGERIAIIDLQTGQRRIVTHGSSPAWSPDGRWLAFTRHRESRDDRVSLHVIRADGTGERTVFVQQRGDMRRGPRYPSPGGWPRDPVWSPDGRRIAFTKHFQGGNTLWVVNADGTGLRRLARRIEPAR